MSYKDALQTFLPNGMLSAPTPMEKSHMSHVRPVVEAKSPNTSTISSCRKAVKAKTPRKMELEKNFSKTFSSALRLNY